MPRTCWNLLRKKHGVLWKAVGKASVGKASVGKASIGKASIGKASIKGARASISIAERASISIAKEKP